MKEYPPRVKDPDYVCECGHYDHDHEVSFFKDIPNIFKNNYPCGHGKCEKCMCPKLKLEKPIVRQKNGTNSQ